MDALYKNEVTSEDVLSCQRNAVKHDEVSFTSDIYIVNRFERGHLCPKDDCGVSPVEYCYYKDDFNKKRQTHKGMSQQQRATTTMGMLSGKKVDDNQSKRQDLEDVEIRMIICSCVRA